MSRIYTFNPAARAPHVTAEEQWQEMCTELNAARDSLEALEAMSTSQAALIDMLRKEVASTKAAHARDEIALTTMRAKFETAAGIILEVLRPPEKAPEPEPAPTAKSVPDEYGIRVVPKVEPPVEEPDIIEMAERLSPISWGTA